MRFPVREDGSESSGWLGAIHGLRQGYTITAFFSLSYRPLSTAPVHTELVRFSQDTGISKGLLHFEAGGVGVNVALGTSMCTKGIWVYGIHERRTKAHSVWCSRVCLLSS